MGPIFREKKPPQKWPPKLIMQNRPGWIPPSPGNVPQAAPLCSGLRGHPGGASGTGGDRQSPSPPGWSNMPSCVDGTERRHFPPISSITSPSTPPPALPRAFARVSVTLYMSRTRHLPAGSIPRAPASPHPGMLLPPNNPKMAPKWSKKAKMAKNRIPGNTGGGLLLPPWPHLRRCQRTPAAPHGPNSPPRAAAWWAGRFLAKILSFYSLVSCKSC